jgi:tryptophan synthase beta chain
LEKVGEKYPDIVIGCVGGGSNFGGMAFPFLRDKIAGTKNFRAIAVEPKSCSTLLTGKYEYDLGDVAGMTPYLKMYTLGHDFIPPGIHAGGLRYHGMAPLVSLLYNAGIIEAQSYKQNEIFDAAVLFTKTEAILPAPESAHAIKAAIEEAKKCKETGEDKVIVFNLSGNGYLDLGAYDIFVNGGFPEANNGS